MDFDETYRKLKDALEWAYVEGELGMGEARDGRYEVVQWELWRAKRLHRVGDENGVRIALRRVAKLLPNVKLRTPVNK